MKRWVFKLTAEVERTVEVRGESFSEAEANAKDLFHEICDGVVSFPHVYLKPTRD